MVESSKLVISEVNFREVAKYVALMVPRELIESVGLGIVEPKRKTARTRNITIIISDRKIMMKNGL